jgi:hypothetical protein
MSDTAKNGLLAEQRITTLRYVFGEFCLLKVRIPALVYSPLFTGEPSAAIEPALVLPQFRDDIAAVLFSSQPIKGDLPLISIPSGLIRYVPNQYPRYYVDLHGTFASYRDNLSSNYRHNLRRYSKRFSEFCEGTDSFRVFRTPDDMGTFHSLARQISQLTYQERLLGVGLPDTEQFRQKLIGMAATDSVRNYVLYHGEKPVAFLYCSVHGRDVTAEVTGYDPAYDRFSPGTLLLYRMLEHLFSEERFRSVDFGSGEALFKSAFSTGSARCADIYFFRLRPWGLFIVLSHAGLKAISRFIVRLLRELKVNDRVKKLLRRRSVRD